MKPLPSGTLCVAQGDDQHLWQLGTAKRIPEAQRGPEWVQAAACVICGLDSEPVDYLQWQKADSERIRWIMLRIEDQIRELENAYDFLLGALTQGKPSGTVGA